MMELRKTDLLFVLACLVLLMMTKIDLPAVSFSSPRIFSVSFFRPRQISAPFLLPLTSTDDIDGKKFNLTDFRSVERECVSPLIELDPKDEAGGVPRIVFVGDSRIRQLYKALMHFMEDGSPPLQYGIEPTEHHDLRWQIDGRNFSLWFIWAPGELDIVRATESLLKSGANIRLIIAGCVLHPLQLTKTQPLNEASSNFRLHMIKLAKLLYPMTQRSRVIWLKQPLANETVTANDKAHITNEKIKLYNQISLTELEKFAPDVEIWSSLATISKVFRDGLHFDLVTQISAVKMLCTFLCGIKAI